MNFREVERTIKDLVGKPFTGKAVVRFHDGRIVACDVGATGVGMPMLSTRDLYNSCVNLPVPLDRPDEVREAEQAEESARQACQDANEALMRARDELRAKHRAANSSQYHAGGLVPVDGEGMATSPDLIEAQQLVSLLTDAAAQSERELLSATEHCGNVTRGWREELRLSKLREEERRTADLAAARTASSQSRIATAIGRLVGV